MFLLKCHENLHQRLLYTLRIELEPSELKLKKNETHPIYSFRYLINRRVTVGENLKRNNPIQCGNCHEFGNTKNYSTLLTLCVACFTSECEILKNGLN